MAGIILTHWEQGREQRAEAIHGSACDAYERLKGLSRGEESVGDTFRLTRFPAPSSQSPSIYRRDGLLVAVAGWWFDPDVADEQGTRLEHLADRYRQEGERVFDGIEGQYLAVVVDERGGEAVVAVDRLGLYPAYVTETDGVAFVATSSSVLATATKPELDTEALRALWFGHGLRAPRSAFRGIRKLSFGEQVHLRRGAADVRRAWTPFRRITVPRRIEDAAAEALAMVRRACDNVRDRWPNAVCDVTSGLDSRLVAAAMTGGTDRTFHATVSGVPEYIDVRISRQLAERFGWKWTNVQRPEDWGRRRWDFFQQGVAMAEGELNGQAIDGTVRTKQMFAETCDAAISGGAGELYREFPWEHVLIGRGRTSRVDIDAYLRYRFFSSSRTDVSLFREDWREAFKADQAAIMRGIIDLAPDAMNTARLDAIYIWRMGGHFGRYAGAVSPIIVSPIPLAIARAIRYTMALPAKWRTNARLIRHMITQAHPELAKMPTCWGGTAEPMGLKHPIRSMPYWTETTKRWARKISMLTIKRPLFADPIMLAPDPTYNTDFVKVLDEHRLLDQANLRTAGLYDPDGLRAFLSRATQADFSQFGLLFAIMTIEVLCRHCDLSPSGE